MPLDWRSAYLMQAKSDHAMLKKLIGEKDAFAFCHHLHYLQMTAEKLAKGLLTPAGGGRYRYTHDAFVDFVRSAKRLSTVREATRITRNEQYNAYINSLAAIAQEIEDLSPEGYDHPNPEYPWEAVGIIYVPAEHSFQNLHFDTPRMRKLLEFIEICFEVM